MDWSILRTACAAGLEPDPEDTPRARAACTPGLRFWGGRAPASGHMCTTSTCTITQVQDVMRHTGFVDSGFLDSSRGCCTTFPDSIACLGVWGGQPL